MSPIGRTFIILNLIAAGVFVGMAGTFMQRQHNWKEAHDTVVETKDKRINELQSENDRLGKDARDSRTSSQAFSNRLDTANRDLERKTDEVKRLLESEADLKASLAGLQGSTSAIDRALKELMVTAQEANAKSLEAIATANAAVTEKDNTVTENRTLRNTIADLNTTIENKNLELADTKATNSRLDLLVSVARQRGFIDRMATPVLDGTVSVVTGKLVTLAITNNPSSAEIKPGYKFAIYDASGSKYKGEARVTSVDAASNAAFCTVEINQGDIIAGDKASTHTAGVSSL